LFNHPIRTRYFSLFGSRPGSLSVCDEARAGQILISQQVHAVLEDLVDVEPIGELTLKGLHRPVTAYNVLGLKNHNAKIKSG
jgi:class 3 adenylate cyclase